MAGSTTIGRGCAAAVSLVGLFAALHGLSGCTSIDPGPDFVVPEEVFDADYYFCHVEPAFIAAQNCGPGGPGDNSSCHYSSSVSGMALLQHPAVDCGGGDHPLDPTQTTGAAESDFEAVSLEMSRDYTTAPLFTRPSSGVDHPRVIFSPDDPTVNMILSTWASK